MSAHSHSFHAYSKTEGPLQVSVSSPKDYLHLHKSDLYAWREVFELYIDADIFDNQRVNGRSVSAIEEAEKRLKALEERIAERGFSTGGRFKFKQSREGIKLFLEMNASILNLLKFQYATSEAIRKILKKHAKRTALPILPVLPSPFILADDPERPTAGTMALRQPRSSATLARILVQAFGQQILPIVPHIDDYTCVICTSIAFKPIRLQCGHLFCVRCLVKMQKRGQGNCPMCRSPTVLIADRSNVDWALLNFMRDWFPQESKQKLHQNEKEAAKEEIEELGLDPQCIIA